MKSKNLRKLVASIAMLALSVTVISGVQTSAAPAFSNQIQNGWPLNQPTNVTTITGNNVATIQANATKTSETIFSVEKIETGIAPNKVQVNGQDFNGDSGVARIGIRLGGNLASAVSAELNDAIREYRNNVNTVNSNRHNSGQAIEIKYQQALGRKLYDLFTNVKEGTSDKNKDVRFLLTYELSDGRSRTTTVALSDLKLETPATTGINSVSDLHSLVDENGLVYLTLRGLPAGVTITNMELDSRSNIFAATNTAGTAYSEQSSLSYNAGRVSIPTSTWILTGSLYPQVTVNGQVFKQFEEPTNSKNDIIEQDEHLFVRVGGNTITLVDLIRDPDNTITGITVTDRRGDTFKAEVGDFVSTNSFSGYKDVKIFGLTTRTNYEFSYMDITYKSGDEERTQRVSFNNSAVTDKVTGADYLKVTTGNEVAAQLTTFNSLTSQDPTVLYQVNVGEDSLQYIVKVNETSNLSRIEVRGLRGSETYKVENVKSEDGKKDTSNWFVVTIENLEKGRNYDFLSLETVYTENGRDRYGTPISLGRRSTALDNVLFPGSVSNGDNIFTTTNNRGYKSELWVDANVKAEQVPGGVKFVARVKDADDILDKVRVYINDNGSYREVDSSNVKVEKSYRVVKGVDVNGSGTISGQATIDYSYGPSASTTQKITFNNEANIESAYEMVEVTVTGIPSNSDREFRLEFGTTQDGNRVSSLLGTNEGAFGAIPTNGTKTQQAVTRYTKGRAGTTKVEVSTSNVKVSNITTTTANVEVSIKNPDKEGIVVEVVGATGVTGKYNVDKNVIELSGLKPGTEYKDLRLTLKYGDKTTTVNVPTFKTTTTSETTTGVAGYVSRVYTTFFNREPDQGGLLYWTERLVGGQETLREFLGQLAYTPELIEKGLTNQQFVERMYAIVDRKGEAEGINFWVGEIEKAIKEGKTQSEARGSVVARMLETPEVQSIATKLGIKY